MCACGTVYVPGTFMYMVIYVYGNMYVCIWYYTYVYGTCMRVYSTIRMYMAHLSIW
jgi:hypothetical protein